MLSMVGMRDLVEIAVSVRDVGSVKPKSIVWQEEFLAALAT